MVISLAVEGASDAAIMRRICAVAGIAVGAEFVARGKGNLDPRIPGYNNAARFAPWLVVRDLDHDADCAPTLLGQLLPDRAPGMCFRVPVRSIEAWLLGDRTGFSKFFGVSAGVLNLDPDALPRPKRTVVDLARRSTKRVIREGMVPVAGTSVEVGPDYTALLVEFAGTVWDPEAASERSDSLYRCLRALRRMAEPER
ncbi:MAG TPA: hypothetical protein VFR37_20760 [Longimicrobium sp.]|nr:hypothetical protein [Longimicrobium sp.]